MMQEYSSSYGSSVTEEQSKDVKHDSWLHTVRKTSSKSCKRSPAAAPMPPTPIQVYKVDPLNFRDLVQQLTGAPEFKPPHHHHLQSAALAPTTSMPVSSSSRDIHVATVTSSEFDWPPQVPFSNLYLQPDAIEFGSRYQDFSSTHWK